MQTNEPAGSGLTRAALPMRNSLLKLPLSVQILKFTSSQRTVERQTGVNVKLALLVEKSDGHQSHHCSRLPASYSRCF